MKKIGLALAALALALFTSVGVASAEASYPVIIVIDDAECYDPMSHEVHDIPLERGTHVMVHPAPIPKWDMSKWTLIGNAEGDSCVIERSSVATPSQLEVATINTMPKAGVNPVINEPWWGSSAFLICAAGCLIAAGTILALVLRYVEYRNDDVPPRSVRIIQDTPRYIKGKIHGIITVAGGEIQRTLTPSRCRIRRCDRICTE